MPGEIVALSLKAAASVRARGAGRDLLESPSPATDGGRRMQAVHVDRHVILMREGVKSMNPQVAGRFIKNGCESWHLQQEGPAHALHRRRRRLAIMGFTSASEHEGEPARNNTFRRQRHRGPRGYIDHENDGALGASKAHRSQTDAAAGWRLTTKRLGPQSISLQQRRGQVMTGQDLHPTAAGGWYRAVGWERPHKVGACARTAQGL